MLRKRALLVALAASCAVFFVGWLALPFEAFRTWATNVGWLSVSAIAGIAALAAASRRENRRMRGSFVFFGLGSISWSVGQAWWSYAELLGKDPWPFPSPADIGYLLALPLFGAGVAAWPRRGAVSRGHLADAGLGVLIAGLVTFEFALEPILISWNGSLENWLALAYPVAEYLIVAPILLGLMLHWWRDRGRILVIACGLVGLASADTAFVISSVEDHAWSTIFDPGWTVPFAAIGAAALMPPGALARRFRRVPQLSVLPVLATLLACVAIADAVESPREAAVGGVASYLIAALIVALAGRGLLLARAREQATAELRVAQAELRRAQLARDRFMVELVNAQETDARKIADVLHDDVVQQLTALGFRLELSAQQHELPKLRELAASTSEITKSIRALLIELHPAILESQGLAPAIEVAAEQLRERGTDVRVTPFPHRLPREVEVVAYRVVLEALDFVAQHGRAPSAQVDLQVRTNGLRGEIGDNGWGVPPEREAHPLGLFVARERVELAGGRFLLASDESDGTIVTFELPLPLEAAVRQAVS